MFPIFKTREGVFSNNLKMAGARNFQPYFGNNTAS